MNKSELILRIANMPDGDITPENVAAALPGGDESRAEVLFTAKEACGFLKISRSSLWRHYPATLKVGTLPRWSKAALLQGAK